MPVNKIVIASGKIVGLEAGSGWAIGEIDCFAIDLEMYKYKGLEAIITVEVED